ncbi:hypothetical protein [Thalassotalea fusca]
MKKLIVPSLVAAIAMFIWGSVFWMSPLPYSATVPLDNQAQLQTKMANTFTQPGTYLFPSMMQQDVEQEAIMALYEQGPIVIAQVAPGRTAFDPMVFGKGFIHYFVVALLMAWLLTRVFTQNGTFREKFDFVSKIAFLLVLFTHGSELIWWGIPAGWTLWTAFYEFIALVLAGVVLAKMIKPDTVADEAPQAA